MDDYIPIKELLNIQNKTEKQFALFQVQSNQDDDFANIINIGNYTNIPLVPIYKFNLDTFKCDIVSFVVLEEELYEKNIKMLSLIVTLNESNNNIIASLDYVFIPNSKIDVNTLNNVKGTFAIVLNMKNKGISEYTTIKKFEKYSGREESVYLLTNILVEEDVIDKIIQTAYC